MSQDGAALPAGRSERRDVVGQVDLDGIVVPGGFGVRGVEGKIAAVTYAREHGIPFLGLCLGMQLLFEESTELGGSTGIA